MDKLDHRQLAIIKRAAEDAIHACNRHYGPFLDVVAHPLNIIALIEMAQSRQAEVDQLKEAMERQGKLAIQAMNEAHKCSRLELSIAKDIQASLKPELIESERQMNAQLTDENMKLEARIDVACKSINSFFDNQVSTPTPREYANFIAEILETLRGEHE